MCVHCMGTLQTVKPQLLLNQPCDSITNGGLLHIWTPGNLLPSTDQWQV